MSFASLTFFLFLPLVFAVYWKLRRPFAQNVLLVGASYFFYAWWDWRFCGLLLLSSLVDYWIGGTLAKTDSKSWRKILVLASLICNLGVLGFFKYFGFFVENLQSILSGVGWNIHPVTLSIVLPVGISFYTFQTLSYTIDIYRRKIDASLSLVNYLAFVSFFPQLVAGPIERAGNLLPQFQKKRVFDEGLATAGLRLIVWGVFKKLVVADQLAVLVDRVYGAPEGFGGVAYGLATVAFAFQIYCDFSAYSDIARGTAQLFAIRLMRNFDYPYFSTSLGEFWRRWHISLSTWFRDYVYIPLGGSRVSPVRVKFNLFLTFLISGFWHGAAWTYLCWGAINGITMMVARQGRCSNRSSSTSLFPDFMTLYRMGLTFSIVCLGWVFFRAESLEQAFGILYSITCGCWNISAWENAWHLIYEDHSLQKAVIVLWLFTAVEWIQRARPCPLEMPRIQYLPVRWAVYSLVLWLTVRLLPPTAGQQFIYFEF